jgi:hypothetical protein
MIELAIKGDQLTMLGDLPDSQHIIYLPQITTDMIRVRHYYNYRLDTLALLQLPKTSLQQPNP